jgi:general secretion pathway protein K
LKGEKGFALIITLVVTVLLATLAVEFVYEVYVGTSARTNFRDGQQAALLAEAGITGGVKLIQMTLTKQNYTSLLDSWAFPLEKADQTGAVQVTIEEESGKLNLNRISLPNGTFQEPNYGQAGRLLKNLGLSTDLLESLADWVDENETPHPNGAETNYYQTLRTPYTAKNSAVESLEELRLVKGFSEKVLEKIRPFVTVYADDRLSPTALININTAPRAVLAVLDDQMTGSLTERILESRKTRPFSSTADLAKVPGMETLAITLQGKIQVKGAVFRLRSTAKVRETTRVIEAVARLSGSQATFLYWREF